MTTERDHARARSAEDDHDHDEQRRGGKHRPSSSMDAPAHAVTSGLIARKADGNGVDEDADAAIARASGSSGTSLPGTIMRKFESSLGADLSNVRVHSGAESQRAASSVGAKAYTVGQDIHFGGGHYDPSSGAGEQLLAHEVAHTVQQRGGSPKRQNKLAVSTPFDAAEHEADSAASAMVAGRSFTVGGGGSGVQRKEGEAAGGEAKAEAEHGGIGPSYAFSIPFDDIAKRNYGWAELSLSGSLSGSVTEKEDEEAEKKPGAEMGMTNDSKGNVGAAQEIKLAQHNLGTLGSWEFTGTPVLEIHAGTDKIEAAAKGSVEVHNKSEPWAHGTLDVGLTLFEIELEKYKKEGLKSIEIAAMTLAGGISVEKTFAGDAKLTLAGSLEGKATLDWKEIGKQVAEKVGKIIGRTAAEGAADTAAGEVGTEVVGEGGEALAASGGAEAGGGAAAAAGPAALVAGAGLAGAATGYGMAKAADSSYTKTGAWGQDAGGNNQSAMDWGAGWGTWVDTHTGDKNAANPSILGGVAAGAGAIVGGVAGTAQAGWNALEDLW